MGLFETFSKWIPVVGPIVSTASDIVGGIAANNANQRIAQQTNQTQIELANMTNQANKELWQMQANYNSMAEQRKRAEEAGFSPNSILGSSGFNSSVSPPPSAVMPQMQMAHPMQNPFVNVGGLFEGLKSMAEIQNIAEQTKQQKIQNDVTRERVMLELKAAGLENVAKEIQNRISAKTEDSVVNMARATLEKLYSDTALVDEKMLSYKLANTINQAFGYKLAEKDLEKKVAEIMELKARSAGHISTIQLNKILGFKAGEEGKTEKVKRLLLGSESGLFDELSEKTRFEQGQVAVQTLKGILESGILGKEYENWELLKGLDNLDKVLKNFPFNKGLNGSKKIGFR